jgi:hypothetical protein
MQRWILCWGVLWLCLQTLPAHAFVSKLHPNDGGTGPIPCHVIRAALVEYIAGTFTAGTLATAMENHYGFTFGPEDAIDNSNLVTLINGQANATAKLLIAFRLESLCVAWEEGFAFIANDPSPKNVLRTKIGIATQ